jgi:hypothetical protein
MAVDCVQLFDTIRDDRAYGRRWPETRMGTASTNMPVSHLPLTSTLSSGSYWAEQHISSDTAPHDTYVDVSKWNPGMIYSIHACTWASLQTNDRPMFSLLLYIWQYLTKIRRSSTVEYRSNDWVWDYERIDGMTDLIIDWQRQSFHAGVPSAPGHVQHSVNICELC